MRKSVLQKSKPAGNPPGAEADMKVCLVSHSSDGAGAERLLLRIGDGLRTRGSDKQSLGVQSAK